MNNPAWKAAVYLQHHWHCCKFSSSWSGIEKCQRTKSRRRHVRNLYSTNFALILPLLQIYNLYMPVKPFLTNTQAYTAPQGLPQVKWRFPFAQPLQVRCGATKHGEERLQARATLKGRFILLSASILLFINLTKPLTRQDCSHTRCMRILRGEAHPNCRSWGSRATTTLQRRRRTLMKKKTTCNSFLATQETQTGHSPGLYVQVHIRVWLPVVECAATWPIKKTKTKHLSQCIFHTSSTHLVHTLHILQIHKFKVLKIYLCNGY